MTNLSPIARLQLAKPTRSRLRPYKKLPAGTVLLVMKYSTTPRGAKVAMCRVDNGLGDIARMQAAVVYEKDLAGI